jgi:putative intracellular protease/amidase
MHLWAIGGQSPMFSFAATTDLHRKFVGFYEAGKLACALCHGVAVLKYARLASGEYLVKGKTVTGFANVEEDFADEAVWAMGALPRGQHLMPWRIEDELRGLGAKGVGADARPPAWRIRAQASRPGRVGDRRGWRPTKAPDGRQPSAKREILRREVREQLRHNPFH